jgi:hypothetical protein
MPVDLQKIPTVLQSSAGAERRRSSSTTKLKRTKMARNPFHETVMLLVKRVLGYSLRTLYAEADHDDLRRTTIQDTLNLTRANPRPGTFEFIAARIEVLSSLYLTKHPGDEAKHHIQDGLARYGLQQLCYLTKNGLVVNPERLRTIYVAAYEQKTNFRMEIQLDGVITQFSGKDAVNFCRQLLSAIQGDPFARLSEKEQELQALALAAKIVKLREKSVALQFSIDGDTARRIQQAFQDGTLPFISGVTIAPEPDPYRSPYWDRHITSHDRFERIWRQVRTEEAIIRPWRRLRWLFSIAIESSPLASMFGDGDNYAYTSRMTANKVASLLDQLFTSWVLWPAFTLMLLTVTLLPLKQTIPELSFLQGAAGGVALAVAGGQVCAAVVSPLAAGAGGIGLGWSFGVALAITTGWFGASSGLGRVTAQQDVFLAIMGGPLGLSAPLWRTRIPTWMILALLSVMATTIAMAGYLMAQPKRAAVAATAPPPSGETSHQGAVSTKPRPILGGLLGSFAGAGIGLTFAVTTGLRSLGLSPVLAFLGGFGVVGGTAFGVMVWRAQARSPLQAAGFAVVFVCLSALIFYAAASGNGALGVILLAVANAVFQALWFTCAHVIGSTFGNRAAILSTTLEGAVGFCGFLAVRTFFS